MSPPRLPNELPPFLWTWLQSGWALLLGIGAAGFALTEISHGFRWTKAYVWSPLCDLFGSRVRRQLQMITQNQSAMTEQLSMISKELRPNGGTSLRDTVDLIDARQILQIERLKAISFDAPVGLKEFSPRGELIWCNRTYLRMVQRDYTELMGYGWINSVFLADRDRVRREWDEVVREGRNYETSYREVTPEGKTFTIAVRATVMRSNLKVIGFMKTVMVVSPSE